MKKKLSVLIILGASFFSASICFSQAEHEIDSLVNEVKILKPDTNKLNNLNTLSKYYLTLEPGKSLDYAEQTLALAQKLNNKKYIFNSYENIGANYYYRSELKNAHDNFQKALEVIEPTGDKISLGKVYSNLSLLAIKQLNYSDAISYSEKAMKVAEELKDSALIAVITNNRGMLYTNIADYPTALSYLLKSLSINEKRHDNQKIANNYFFIGCNYIAQGKEDKALEYFQLGLKAAKESNDVYEQVQTLDKIGQVYRNKKELNTALDYFQRANNTGREIGGRDNISSLQNIAMIYNEQGNFDMAIEYISKALVLTNDQGDKLGTGNNYGCLGEIYLKKKEYKTAIPYFNKSLQIAKDTKAKDNEAAELLNLATTYQSLNNYKQGYNYLMQYQAVKDSILSNETIMKTAETEAKYSLDKKEKEIALLTKDKEIKALEIKKQTTLKNSFIIGLALVCILFVFALRNYRTRQLLKLQTLRNKIAIDLHDDVGSTLSSIAIFSEIARQESKEVAPMLDQISESSRKMLESMADIVWTINPENDNFEKIVLRMRSFAFELLGTKKIDFEFNADDSVINLMLPMDVRKNLYLIFKEATNNIVKYADANRASFSISGSKNNLTMLIRDNGKGFDIEKQTKGNGLKNMRSRAMDIGAKFLIESEPGKGTTIQLLLKTA